MMEDPISPSFKLVKSDPPIQLLLDQTRPNQPMKDFALLRDMWNNQRSCYADIDRACLTALVDISQNACSERHSRSTKYRITQNLKYCSEINMTNCQQRSACLRAWQMVILMSLSLEQLFSFCERDSARRHLMYLHSVVVRLGKV